MTVLKKASQEALQPTSVMYLAWSYTTVLLQDSLDSLAAEQPAPTQEPTTASMAWRGITYEVRNKQVQAKLQEVAAQQDSAMQTDPPAAGQYDSLIAALNDTKASLAAVLKAAPGQRRCDSTFQGTALHRICMQAEQHAHSWAVW